VAQITFPCISPSKHHAETPAHELIFGGSHHCIVTDGEPDSKVFDACWNSLAHPAVVSVTK
jgi:hypothetical protein